MPQPVIAQPGMQPGGMIPQPGTLPAPGAPPAPGGQAQVRFAPNAIDAAPGGAVQAMVQIDNVADLFSASPIRVKYDAALLKLNDLTPGELFTRDGVRITSVKDIRNEVGEATLTIARSPGSKGISGSLGPTRPSRTGSGPSTR